MALAMGRIYSPASYRSQTSDCSAIENRTYISHLLIGDSLRCQPKWCVDPLKPPPDSDCWLVRVWDRSDPYTLHREHRHRCSRMLADQDRTFRRKLCNPMLRNNAQNPTNTG